MDRDAGPSQRDGPASKAKRRLQAPRVIPACWDDQARAPGARAWTWREAAADRLLA